MTDQQAPSTIETLLGELSELVQRTKQDQLRIGEIVEQLTGTYKLTLTHVAETIGGEVSTLSEYRSVFRRFRNPEDRPPAATYTDLLQGDRHAKRQVAKREGYDAKTFVETIVARRLAGEPTNARDVMTELVERAEAKAKEDAAADAQAAPASLHECCLHRDCREVLRSGLIPAGTVQCFNFDPPYPGLQKVQGAGYISGRAASACLRTDCDNRSDKEAMKLIYDVFSLSLPMLAPGGCLLFWDFGEGAPNWRALRFAARAGWYCQHALYWNKGPSQPGNFEFPWSVSTERLYVLVRAGEFVRDHAGKESREQDIRGRRMFPAVTRQIAADIRAGKADPFSGHQFEKPVELCEHLLRKVAYPGQLTVDLCGCSGSWAEAATRNGCPYLYIESNTHNYEYGLSRLAAAQNSGKVAQ